MFQIEFELVMVQILFLHSVEFHIFFKQTVEMTAIRQTVFYHCLSCTQVLRDLSMRLFSYFLQSKPTTDEQIFKLYETPP